MFLEIALDTPLRRVFDYRCPSGVARDALRPGMRVRVPFGRRRLVGILVGINAETQVSAEKIRTALEVLDTEPLFDPVSMALVQWAADYYRHPIGEVFAAALPAPLRAGAPVEERIARWRMTPLGFQSWMSLPKQSTRLRALAADVVRGATQEQFAEITPTWRAGLRALEARGWVERSNEAAPPSQAATTPMPGLDLTAAQRAALDEIESAFGQFRTLLLHGVTGSGKTEVYLQAIAKTIASERQALVLAPEIALTPQLVERFKARFGETLAVMHSGLTDSERLQAWRAARSGAARIVIGTRSAIFAPLRAPGLIIVDEEHDPSYKQQEGFRYSARDLAIVRAQRLGIPVVLGSATPSLESLARAKKQPRDWLVLPERAGAAEPPHVRLIDLRKQAVSDGLAGATIAAIEAHLQLDGQVLLYLNRRGYAPVLFCPQCGWSAACHRCDARMTLHQRTERLVCHHCGHEDAIPAQCPSCAAVVKPVGQGTERIESALGRLFPDVAIARIDRDNIKRKGDLEATLERIHSGAVRLLVGTQMLTKGHHFPNVTLAVVLNADQGLFSADFRASERLAQTIVQVAGRAGRAERSGEVLIQTEYPEHPLLQSLLKGGYTAFAEQALCEREHARWPPFARLALLRAEAPAMGQAMQFLDAARRAAHPRGVTLYGPVAAPMPRRAGQYRAQLLVHAPTHAPLQRFLADWVPRLDALPAAKRARWSIDVDPLELF